MDHNFFPFLGGWPLSPKSCQRLWKPSMYYPTALTSCLCKTVEKMANIQMIWTSGKTAMQFQESLAYSWPAGLTWNIHWQRLYNLEKVYDTAWKCGISSNLLNLAFRGHLPLFFFIPIFYNKRWVYSKAVSFLLLFLILNSTKLSYLTGFCVFTMLLMTFHSAHNTDVQHSFYTTEMKSNSEMKKMSSSSLLLPNLSVSISITTKYDLESTWHIQFRSRCS